MAQVKYTVKSGDTLRKIAAKYSTTVNKLLELNPDIVDENFISVGQVIVVSGEANKKTTNRSLRKAVITNFGLQSKKSGENTLFATWAWDAENTDHYETKWTYDTGVGVDFIGSQSDVNEKQSVYSGAPYTAYRVAFQVRPIAKSYEDGSGNQVKYWTTDWSTINEYYFENSPPDKPSAPTVEIKDSKLTAKLNYTDSQNRATTIKFQVVKDNETIFDSGDAQLKTSYASYSCRVDPGSEYKVRCRAISLVAKSDWSDYSSNIASGPAASDGINVLYAISSTSVGIGWYEVKNATGYEIEYTNILRYFDSNPSGVSSVSISSVVTNAEITGLTPGYEYFFRVRAKNDEGNSPWCPIKSLKIGEAPSAPTTWSSTSTAIVGDQLNLYWIHNSADDSRQSGAEIELDVSGTLKTYRIEYGTCITASVTADKVVQLPNFTLTDGAVVKVVMTFANTSVNPTLNVNETGAIAINAVNSDSLYWPANSLVTFTYSGEKWNMTEYNSEESTNSYSVDTSGYIEGTKIKWRIRTSGILTDLSGNRIFSDWSIQRTVDIYNHPTLELIASDLNDIVLGTETETDASGTTIVTTLKSFPFTILATAGPNTQTPVGYHLSITSKEIYETIDNIGNTKTVNSGEEVYSKYFDISTSPFKVEFSANDVNLENNISYKITCTVSMNSGLTAEKSTDFRVEWGDDEYGVNAEVSYDPKTCTAYIGPYCQDENGSFVTDVTLAVYRREFDGSFIEIASGLSNTDNIYVTDPHPSLDYARYRIVAISNSTGSVTYYDIPAIPTNEKAVVIQWNENWSNFDIVSEDPFDQPTWSGSMLKLPYNIDISDKHASDVELIEYIGRKRPVSYYGTQIGHSSTWSMSIPKSDTETLYMLRRLATWMGDVYVREPSGSGYWASIKVSFSQKHCEVTIPVSFDVIRVEGGK